MTKSSLCDQRNKIKQQKKTVRITMEFAVNWIVFSAIAIAVSSSLETRKLSKTIQKEEKKNLRFFSAIFILLTFSWH